MINGLDVRGMEKLLLVLDLDETLIHVTTREDVGRMPEHTIHGWPLYERPHVQDFLDFCFSEFRVGVWTSASRSYAKGIVYKVFGDRVPEFIWWDEKCTQSFDSELLASFPVKDIRKLVNAGYSKDRILAIDDTPRKWQRSYGNYLQVKPFEGERDNELEILMKYLPKLKNVENIREIEKRGWRGEVT